MYHKFRKIDSQKVSAIKVRTNIDKNILERWTFYVEDNDVFSFSEDFFTLYELDEQINITKSLFPTIQYDIVLLEDNYEIDKLITIMIEKGFIHGGSLTGKICNYLQTIYLKSYPYNIRKVNSQKPMEYDFFIFSL